MPSISVRKRAATCKAEFLGACFFSHEFNEADLTKGYQAFYHLHLAITARSASCQHHEMKYGQSAQTHTQDRRRTYK
eukprot:1246627-Amphidinium_carterae.1